jgi:hypothetical protein
MIAYIARIDDSMARVDKSSIPAILAVLVILVFGDSGRG